jgi:chromosome partitioning protein
MIWALCGLKGGSGKSTTTICIACELHERGKQVLIADAESSGSALTWEEIAREEGHTTVPVIGVGPNLWKPDRLPRISAQYDITLIDCPPLASEVQRAALAIADVAILPCSPSPVEVAKISGSVELIQEAQQKRDGLFGAVLLTRVFNQTTLGESVRSIVRNCGLPVLKTTLGFRHDFQYAFAAGMGVTQFAPTSTAADEMRALVDELLALKKGKRK